MNYEVMSDFEIDRMVFVAANGVDLVQKAPYCSSPSDAWPIIVEHGICLTSPTAGRKHQLWSASWNEGGGRWSHGDITHGDKNPLRAAMICFLKMKHAE